ncbi:hypothetical protein EBS43_08830 [bacterium]|nr:hypothetical protein [bacterium]
MMNRSNPMVNMSHLVQAVEAKATPEKKVAHYRFDIFKGTQEADGKIRKVRSVGGAYVREGLQTYTISLKTFLNDKFYLLPNTKPENRMDYVILTREPAQNINRKYFWHSVGEGHFLEGVNHGLMKLSWDVLGDDLYMSLHPVQVNDSGDSN